MFSELKICRNFCSGGDGFELQMSAVVFAEQFTDVKSKPEVLGMAGIRVLCISREKRINGLANRIFVESVPVVGHGQQQPLFPSRLQTRAALSPSEVRKG